MASDIDVEFSEILDGLQSAGITALSQLKTLNKKFQESDGSSEGLGFLEVKNQMMASYLVNLMHVLVLKSRGESLQMGAASESVERLVELRIVLERMRPLEQKLDYQIGKLLRLAETGQRAADDPHMYRANPANLESQMSDSESEDSEDGEEEESKAKDKKSKAYVPPHNTPMHFDDEPELVKAQRRLDASRRQALTLGMLQELREQHSEAPTEIKEAGTVVRARLDRELQERQRYEEDTFTRLNVTKQDKARMDRLRSESSLKDLTRFGNLGALNASVQDFVSSKKKKSLGVKRTSKKGSKKKKTKKKFGR